VTGEYKKIAPCSAKNKAAGSDAWGKEQASQPSPGISKRIPDAF